MNNEVDRVWTCQPDGSEFTEHFLDPRKVVEDTTLCGVTRSSLPAIEMPRMAGLPEEKNWFSDHDRSDVIKCLFCFSVTIGAVYA